jgi:hypothetical protein
MSSLMKSSCPSSLSIATDSQSLIEVLSIGQKYAVAAVFFVTTAVVDGVELEHFGDGIAKLQLTTSVFHVGALIRPTLRSSRHTY